VTRLGARGKALATLIAKKPDFAIWLFGAVLWSYLMTRALRSADWGLDLDVFRGAARALVHGRNPYQLSFTSVRLPYTYPPSSFLLFLPLGFLAQSVVSALWLAANLVVTTVVFERCAREALRLARHRSLAISVAAGALATCVLQPLRSNFGFGQVNLILFLLVVIDCFSEQRPWRGCLVGLAAAVKVIPLGFVLYFLIQKDVRAAARALATFVTAEGLTWLILPSESTHYWTSMVFDPAHGGNPDSVHNQSINGLLHRLMGGGPARSLVWAGLVLVVMYLAVPLARALVLKQRRLDALIVIAITTNLSSPISWSHHWVGIITLPLLLMRGFRGQRVVTGAVLLFLFSALFKPSHWQPHFAFAPIMSFPLVFSAIFLLIVWRVSETPPHVSLRSGHQRASD
jgi:alpha-1,2-mannosyltransferase